MQFSIERQRITIPQLEGAKGSADSKIPSSVVPADEQTLVELGLGDGAVLNIKDLGNQISWKAVYIIEYVRTLVVVGGLCVCENKSSN